MTDRNSAGYKVDNYLPEYIIKISDKRKRGYYHEF